MKKLLYILFILCFQFSMSNSLYAQEVKDEFENDTVAVVEEDEEDEEDQPSEAIEDNGEKFDLPEALTDEVDSLLDMYDVQQYLKIDPNCQFPNVNPEYSPEVYQERLAKLPTLIELPYNSVVQKFIDRYTGKLRHSVSIMLGLSNFYMPIFEEALEKYNLPLELKYLPVIESALNPRATSRVGAAGLWQFMIGTGKQYGLDVNTLVDERRDPVKASYAAAHYLSRLYKIFGNWSLVIASYNCGPTNVSKAIHRSGGKKDFWEIYPYLPAETRGYVPAFIAANYVMNYYCEHNICPMLTTLPAKTDTVMLSRDVHFEQIASVLNIPIKQIEALNPQYRHQIIPGSSKLSPLRLEQKDILSFIDNQDSIYAYHADELLSHRTTVEVNEDRVYTYKHSRYSRHSKRSKRSKSGKSATIRQGDTLSEIAHRNHTTVAKLKKLNHIKGSSIRAGKKLRVR